MIPPKCKRLEGIIHSGGPKCPHYLPNTVMRKRKKSKRKVKNVIPNIVSTYFVNSRAILVNPIGIYLLSLHGLDLHEGEHHKDNNYVPLWTPYFGSCVFIRWWARFLFEKWFIFIFFRKMTWSHHLFLFYF